VANDRYNDGSSSTDRKCSTVRSSPGKDPQWENGSDVTTAAVRLARAVTGRPLVAVCSDQPFFSTDDWFIGVTAMAAGIPDAISELTLAFPYGDLAATEQLLQKYGTDRLPR